MIPMFLHPLLNRRLQDREVDHAPEVVQTRLLPCSDRQFVRVSVEMSTLTLMSVDSVTCLKVNVSGASQLRIGHLSLQKNSGEDISVLSTESTHFRFSFI